MDFLTYNRTPVLHEVWVSQLTMFESKKKDWERSRSSTALERGLGSGSVLMEGNPWTHRFIMKPSSKYRWAWELFGLAIMVYQVYWIPFTVFDPPEYVLFVLMQWTALLYWSFDVLMTFLTGYTRRDGVTEMRPSRIAHRYLKHWFLCDIVFVALDWLSEVSLKANGLSTMKVMMRIGRFLRLLRVIKVCRMSESSLQRVQSIELLTMLKMAGSTGLIHVMSHWMACGWYAVGTSFTLSEYNWLSLSSVAGNPTQERSLGYKYWTSMHWSLSQLGVGAVEIMPVNIAERMYAVIMLILSLLSSSFFVSRVTALMVDLQSIKAEQSERDRRLREYLNDNNVSLHLKSRIWKYLQDVNRSGKRMVLRDSVIQIRHLPKDMLTALNTEIYFPLLKAHPFFNNLLTQSGYEAVRRELVNTAVEEMTLDIEKELFDVGEPAEKMYFIVHGSLRYKHEHYLSLFNDPNGGDPVEKGDWLSEIALWLQTTHFGLAIAREPCQMLTLQAEMFRDLLKKRTLARTYAKQFFEYLKDNTDEISDLFVFSIDQPMFDVNTEAEMSFRSGRAPDLHLKDEEHNGHEKEAEEDEEQTDGSEDYFQC